MRILVTGCAGFIGSHVCEALLSDGMQVVGVDCFDEFYDPRLKWENISEFVDNEAFKLLQADIRQLTPRMVGGDGSIDAIVHLAARAGVRPSIVDPILYQDVNVAGTQTLLEVARSLNVKRFVFASSSSVYGNCPNIPWIEDEPVLRPISPYASTKVSGELLGHVYSHLYGMSFIALRFFTVFGPRQRPDLAIRKFASSILDGVPIRVFGNGDTGRDYTYIRDVVSGIVSALSYSGSGFEVFNLGNCYSVRLSDMIGVLEQELGVRAVIVHDQEQPGDVRITCASIEKASRLMGYCPSTSFCEGIGHFCKWLREQRGACVRELR